MSEQHVDVDAYVAGLLAPNQAAGVEQHIDSCEVCRMDSVSLREMREFLGEVPPEAMLEGYPDDADLVLQRALRQVRTEKTAARRRSRFLTAAAAVVAAAALVTGGVLVGQSTTSQPVAVPTVTQPEGVRFANSTDSETGARLVVRVTPAAGWARVNAAVSGIPAGEPCRLIVVSKDGTRESAGSWVVPDNESGGTTLDGSALIPANDITTVLVETTDGKRYVTANI
ncbi:anti-sigma factor [Kibdelosporangium aridum]|uniref:Anti-sigma factor n=1 Tax=Kibdelosporangium aridum TaxID=2030 RepID=A0A428Y8E8_KIBAR|nr:zf-HC2 domain-containing protein [Kibdelosporangium aridum]RSM63849.1 anti-sigma factor [Kibdelosporangium aridum]